MQTPFDILAPYYDDQFALGSIGHIQRMLAWHFLSPVIASFNRPIKILELNCGTGEDAIMLAKQGHQVIATDASKEMIKRAEQKLAMLPVRPDVSFSVARFDQISNLTPGPFDLVLSNFGGLNCINEADLNQLSGQLYDLLARDGKLFFVVMGNLCLWEMLYFSAKMKFGKAFRRLNREVKFKMGDQEIDIYYHSPSAMRNAFRQFRFQKVKPIGLLVPPTYLEQGFSKRKKFLAGLHYAEKSWNHSLFSNLADHYCISFKREEK